VTGNSVNLCTPGYVGSTTCGWNCALIKSQFRSEVYRDARLALSSCQEGIKYDKATITDLAREPGLPDFYWCMIPKPGKNVPNEHKMYQMNTKCTK
jgi:hypothetical protein